MLLQARLGFHGNFWSHVEMDLTTGRLLEKEQLLSTEELLYHMTDRQSRT